MKEKQNFLRKKSKALLSLFMITLVSLMCVGSMPVAAKTFSKKYTLTGNQAQDITAVVRAQKGRTKAQIGYTGAWCAAFVLDCAKLANIPETVIPYNYDGGKNCENLYNRLIKKCNAQKVTKKNAKPGDIVFYYCSACKKYVHVGFYDGKGYCIEGNVYYKGKSQVLKYSGKYTDGSKHTVASGKIKQVFVHPNYKKSMSDCKVKLSVTSMTYSGKTRTPAIKVTYGNTTLKNNIDYTFTAANNINAGTATLTVSGKGNYAGTQKVTYKITPRKVSTLTYSSIGNKTYTGVKIMPVLTVKCGTKTLKLGTDYTVAYGKNLKPGKATVKVTGKGNFTGSKTITFYIVPKKVTGLKLTNVLNKQMKVSFNKATGASGYQIAYRPSGTSAWTYRKITSNTTTLDKEGLGLIKYQVRVRPYVKITSGSQKVYKYGSWCKIVTK